MSGFSGDDRYSAAGIDCPDTETVCGGECEGMGIIPIFMKTAAINPDYYSDFVMLEDSEKDPTLIKLWKEAEKELSSPDGYHFVTCPICGGSGKRPRIQDEQKR